MLPLYPHQVKAIDDAMTHRGNLAIFHEPGLGKTRTALEIYSHLKALTPKLKMLVVCPLSLVEAVWKIETEAYTSFKWCSLKLFNRSADVFVINYESIRSAAGQKLLQESDIMVHPLLLVCDESSRLKDSRSLTTKILLDLSSRCAHRLVMSGTPAPNDLSEIWAQIKIVAPERLHRSFFAFRREWFYLGRNDSVTDPSPSKYGMMLLFKQGYKWRITKENQTRLLAAIAPSCSWVRKKDALDLPEKINTIRYVRLGSDEQQAYDTMKKELVVEFEKEYITAEIALTKLMKLRQIASGFLYGETTHQIGTSRLNVLLETLEELGNQPVIIWTNFHEEIEQISKTLGDKSVTLYANTKDRAASLAAFGTTAQYLVAHPRSAGHGLTLTQASTCIWYSLDWSWEAYTQANDRCHRIGQTKPVLYIHLIGKGLIDEEIYEVLQRKQTLQAAIDRTLRGRPAPRGAAEDSTAMASGVVLGWET